MMTQRVPGRLAMMTVLIVIVSTWVTSAHAEAVSDRDTSPGGRVTYWDIIYESAFTRGLKPAWGGGVVFAVSVFSRPEQKLGVTVPDGGGLFDEIDSEETAESAAKDPDLFLHLQGTVKSYGGDNVAASGNVGLTYRLPSTLLTVVGLNAVVSGPPLAFGPVFRGELAYNVGLQFGWMFIDDDDDDGGLFVSVDFGYQLFSSIGLF